MTDGNLVLYLDSAGSSTPLWDTKTANSGSPPYILYMQSDGNLVLYANAVPQWDTKTYKKGTAPYSLAVQSDGNVVLYDSVNKALWDRLGYVSGVKQ